MELEDVLVQFAERGVQISIQILGDDTVLIEADRESLQFMSAMFAAAATSEDCGIQLHPNGAGASLFAEAATLGIYAHRLPCEHNEG